MINNIPSKSISIIGAGLVGTILSILLAQRGFHVRLIDSRHVDRPSKTTDLRSINLTVCTRGLRTLEQVGLAEEVIDQAQPLFGRVIHHLTGSTTAHRYGMRNECIYAISRSKIHQILIERATREQKIELVSGARCVKIDLETGQVTLQHDGAEPRRTELNCDLIIGADGANSVVRKAIAGQKNNNIYQSNFPFGYKEILIPREQAKDLTPGAFHVWPRGKYMIGASRNGSGDVSATLIMPLEGPESFDAISYNSGWKTFFAQNFPDLEKSIPDFDSQLHQNPVYRLGSIKVRKWHHKDRVVIIGDAAHAITPFYGQGMNAGFEDCTVLLEILDSNRNDWAKTLSQFQDTRQTDAWAIADLAESHFNVLSDGVADELFILKKQIDSHLQGLFGKSWTPVFSLISFTNIPYAKAVAIGNIQNKILDEILAIENISDTWRELNYREIVDLSRIEELL